jgi:hypothetical protein
MARNFRAEGAAQLSVAFGELCSSVFLWASSAEILRKVVRESLRVTGDAVLACSAGVYALECRVDGFDFGGLP